MATHQDNNAWPVTLTAWLDYWMAQHSSAIDLGLSRIRPVAAALDVLHPQAVVFTVAGTNGKGSTTTAISSICQAAGYTVGLYQSPHIRTFNERIRLNGSPVSDALLLPVFERIATACTAQHITLSFFEATTLAALMVFQQQKVDVWVLEVGLGGRLDAVNLIDPTVAVITNIGLDHTEWLGDTLEDIGREKAGILRDAIPVVLASTMPSSVVQATVAHHNTVIQHGTSYAYQVHQQALVYSQANETVYIPKLHLAAHNVAAAIAAVNASALTIDLDALQRGISAARLEGRFECVQLEYVSNPESAYVAYLQHTDFLMQQQGDDTALTSVKHVIFDAAHNAHGMHFLVNQLNGLLAQGGGQRVLWVWSMLADKNCIETLQAAQQLKAPNQTQWFVGELTHSPRFAPLQQLTDALESLHVSYTSYARIQQAFVAAIAHATVHDLVVVCGSFYTQQEIKEVILHYEYK